MEKLSLLFLLMYVSKKCLAVEEPYYCSFASIISIGYIKRDCEVCEHPWIKQDFDGLEKDLTAQLFGQHLAKTAIIRSLKGFLKSSNPEKALAMSFNGITGSGKTFVSRLISERLYERKDGSKFVHRYIANKDFPHAEKVSQYQDRVRDDIIRFTKECGRSLFIFEEVEKMPAGTIDCIKPFLDYHSNIDGVDFRKNIFIFLSNSGSQSINEKALEYWAQSRDREDIRMEDIDPLVSKGSFNEKGGFQYSELLSSALIDVFVPFLPLEKKHIESCIRAELFKEGVRESPELVKTVADSLQYFPPETDLFSQSGCKRIKSKLDLNKDW